MTTENKEFYFRVFDDGDAMPEAETPMYQAHICYTHLDPLADVLGVYGCCCMGCEQARHVLGLSSEKIAEACAVAGIKLERA